MDRHSEIVDLRAEIARRKAKMAVTHGVGAAVALALHAKAEHDAHTARSERHYNCEFCELATLVAKERHDRKQLIHDRLHTRTDGPSPVKSLYGPQADCDLCEVRLSADELLREHWGHQR